MMIRIIGAGIFIAIIIIIALWVIREKPKKAWRVKGHKDIAFKSMYEAIRYAKLIGLPEEEGNVYYA